MGTKERLEILTEHYKSYFPDDIEAIVMTKEDYDRNFEQLLLEKINAEKEIERLNNIINKAIEFVESMGYGGYEDYFYDLTTEDKNGNDNCFVDSQRKLLSILKGSDKE